MIAIVEPLVNSAQYIPDGDLLLDTTELGCEFLSQLPNCEHEFDKVAEFIHLMFESGWCRLAIDTESNVVVGMWLSYFAENPFSGAPTMMEVAWYVDEEYRNTGIGMDLLATALGYAAYIDAKVHMSTVGNTSTKTERRLEQAGFVRGETVWRT